MAVSGSSQEDFYNNSKELQEPEDLITAIRAELRPAIEYWNAHHADLSIPADDRSSLGSGDDIFTYNERQPLLPIRESVSLFSRISLLYGRMEGFTQSWYFVAVLLHLLAVPIAYLYMGSVHFEECDYVKHFPIMFLLMGISALFMVVVSVIRIVVVKVYDLEWFTLWWIHIFPLLLFSNLYLYQAISFLSLEYSVPPGNKMCPLVFYDFAWMNEWIAPSMMFILMLIC